ncbi:MAG: 30S ribosomal protein S6 [Candidatus Pacebacteria bacterium]|nr:30S ribosomal protein S6 [Candidatus Paceibacterota bacterium]
MTAEENNTNDEISADNAEVQVYELGYHILPTVVADDLEGEVAKLRSAIEKRGGSFITEGTPEMTTLSYPMFVNNGGKKTKYEQAYFGWMKFEMAAGEAIALRDEDLVTNAQVLRHILFKTTREETRAQLQTAQNNILREIKTTGVLEKKTVTEEGGEVSQEQLEKSIKDLVGDDKEAEEKKEEDKKEKE